MKKFANTRCGQELGRQALSHTAEGSINPWATREGDLEVPIKMKTSTAQDADIYNSSSSLSAEHLLCAEPQHPTY